MQEINPDENSVFRTSHPTPDFSVSAAKTRDSMKVNPSQ